MFITQKKNPPPTIRNSSPLILINASFLGLNAVRANITKDSNELETIWSFNAARASVIQSLGAPEWANVLSH